MGASSSKLATAPLPSQEVMEEKMSSSMNSLSILERDATPLSSSGVLSPTLIENWESEALSDPRTKLARTVLATADVRASLLDRTAQIADQHVFNHVIDFKTGPRTDQKNSGRCWLFATTNVLRYEVMKKLNISELELSQASLTTSYRPRAGRPVLVAGVTDHCSYAQPYLFFWDKLNKSNYYLELSIENADKPLDDRLVYFLSDDLINDGGQWDMVVNVLEVPSPNTRYPIYLHSPLFTEIWSRPQGHVSRILLLVLLRCSEQATPDQAPRARDHPSRTLCLSRGYQSDT